MSSCKKVFKLRQNTPIWHFQYSQAGATLRASEVKPKFDKYIIANCKEIDDKWYVNEGKSALGYKMRIYFECEHTKIDQLPMFFANLGSSKKPECLSVSDKKALSGKEICLEIFSLHSKLMELIESQLKDFFFVHNFGSRQSKGFGSFSLVEKGGIANPELDKQKEYVLEKGITLKFKSFFEVKTLKKGAPFNEIEVFSKSIRSGINDCRMLCFNSNGGKEKKQKYLDVWLCGYNKKKNKCEFCGKSNECKCEYKGACKCIYKQNCSVFHMKSMLFNYLCNKGVKWDKQQLKSIFDPNNGCADSGEMIVLWRDMLGLAERTKLYGGDLEKKGDINLKRFKSPIFIKPVKLFDDKGRMFYRVYLGFVNTIEKYEVAGRSIEVLFKRNRHEDERRSAKMAELDISDYLDYVINKGHEILDGTMSSNNHTYNGVEQKANYTQHEFYSMLKGIYSELNANMNEKR